MNFRDQKLLLLLIYPDIVKNYSEVTLSHMPIETNEFLIRHIFKSINKDLDTCFVKRQPGAQLRSDRWELILDCKGNEDEIPEGFILPKRSPENEDINVKIIVRGREPKQRKENMNVDNTFTGLLSVNMSNQKPPMPCPTPLASPPPNTPHAATPTQSGHTVCDTSRRVQMHDTNNGQLSWLTCSWDHRSSLSPSEEMQENKSEIIDKT